MARLKQKNRVKLESLFEEVQVQVDTASIYRGKAVRFKFPSDDPDEFDPTVSPTFLDLSRHNPDEVVFPRDIQHLVDMTLLTPLRHTQVLRDQGIPLKRGVLLAGEYGVGKTLLAYKTAHVAVNNGWSYLYAEAGQLRQAIEYGLLYEPCVIFAEDLDSALGGQTRSDAVNDVLNTIDGVNVKGREVMVVLTTNHLDKINQAMLRPGRLDAVIRIPPPDADAAERLIRLYARGRLAAGEKLMDVGARLAGQIPSAIREVVERAKLATITRTGNGDEKLTASDLLLAAHGMQHHLELLQPRPVDTRSDIEKAAGVLVEGITAVELRSNGNGHDRDPLNLDELPYTPGSLGLTYRE
jgi:transitional endoplasmic reticulum ATPase